MNHPSLLCAGARAAALGQTSQLKPQIWTLSTIYLSSHSSAFVTLSVVAVPRLWIVSWNP
ncbi:hypothetical protein I7I50_06112 [Histoplasma capsulatum G186AR]|uniref:Uncharacterized protein n=1 Tax=Ajellomyces capsulatus TaxID=5037 RepID=A0A8H7Z8N1_AJECA|nr:hypothetical protein I7I52_01111 [Histoplasma capsulatum]QSS67119.1 hypothetical protein I7I50_06112 [Histoplasma capsulatum G186AR]